MQIVETTRTRFLYNAQVYKSAWLPFYLTLSAQRPPSPFLKPSLSLYINITVFICNAYTHINTQTHTQRIRISFFHESEP